jgi:transcriptional regulator with XRE-family HTH domain
MANRWNPQHDAARFADWVIGEIGREILTARVSAGMTQRQVAGMVGRSASWVSRVENGRFRSIAVRDLVRVAAAVGMKLYVKTFPSGRRPLDAAQLALITTFNARLHPSWSRQLEVVMPIDGDLRAIDELIRNDACSCAVEAVTRFADVQRQARNGRLKQRDFRADRLILVVRRSRANLRMLRASGPVLREYFPVPGREALRALTEGRDPGGDALIAI